MGGVFDQIGWVGWITFGLLLDWSVWHFSLFSLFNI